VALRATHTDKEIIYSLTYTPTAKFALWRYAPPTPTQRKYLFFDTETGSKIRTVALRATNTDKEIIYSLTYRHRPQNSHCGA
jgi:hypothetical protein